MSLISMNKALNPFKKIMLMNNSGYLNTKLCKKALGFLFLILLEYKRFTHA